MDTQCRSELEVANLSVEYIICSSNHDMSDDHMCNRYIIWATTMSYAHPTIVWVKIICSSCRSYVHHVSHMFIYSSNHGMIDDHMFNRCIIWATRVTYVQPTIVSVMTIWSSCSSNVHPVNHMSISHSKMRWQYGQPKTLDEHMCRLSTTSIRTLPQL